MSSAPSHPRAFILSKRYGHTVTKCQLVLRDRMKQEGFRFKFEWGINTDSGRFQVDFLVEGFRQIDCLFVVEVRGEVHYTKNGRRKDRWRARVLRKEGYPVVWVENNEVRIELDNVIRRLKEYVKEHAPEHDGEVGLR